MTAHSTRSARSGQALTVEKLHRPEAIEIAKAFIDELDGCYDQLVVGGSLRRRLAWVHDIEIVAVPIVDEVDLVVPELFESRIQRLRKDRLDERMSALLEAGTVTKRFDRNGLSRWGPTLKFLTYRGARVDLFTPAEPERFGWILLLRTGPAAFSRQLVAWQGTRTRDNRPGLLPLVYAARDGWLCESMSGRRVETPDERTVFEVIGLPYLEPWERV